MNKQFRNHVTSVLLLLPATAWLVAAPVTALAQQQQRLEVRSLEIRGDPGFDPGSRVTFTVVGTPRADAEVRVRALRETIELRETSPGVYVGYYTMKRDDRAAPNSEVRATISIGDRRATGTYTLGEAMQSRRAPPQRVPELPPLRIERFSMAPLERIEPGAQLRFALDGASGGSVVVDLPGISENVTLREVRPGHYEGSYTLRRSDRFNPNQPSVATLRLGERVVTASTGLAPPAVDNRPPPGRVIPAPPPGARVIPPPPPPVMEPPHPLPAEILTHQHNGDIGTDPVRIAGRTAPGASVFIIVNAFAPPGVVLRELPPVLFRETVQADANGNFAFVLVPQIPYPGVRYEIVMVATRGGARAETRTMLTQRG